MNDFLIPFYTKTERDTSLPKLVVIFLGKGRNWTDKGFTCVGVVVLLAVAVFQNWKREGKHILSILIYTLKV